LTNSLGGPLSKEAVENFKSALEPPVLGGFATAVRNATIAHVNFIKALQEHSLEEAGLRTAALNDELERLLELTGANEFTTFIDGIGRSFEEDVLPPMEEVIAGLGEAETVTERWLKLQEALAAEAGEAPKFVAETKEEANLAADAAGRFAQNLARALATGQNLADVIKSFAINLALSLLPGGSLFEKFEHGGIAPGGFIPSIVGEGGGAPEIVQSASPIRVTPLTTNNDNSRRIININVTTTDLSDFALKNDIIPRIKKLEQEF